MLTDRDRYVIERIVEAFPNEVAFQILCTFRERVSPSHYIYAGELIGMKKAPKFNTENYHHYAN